MNTIYLLFSYFITGAELFYLFFIVAFLPGGEAYINIDAYAGGFMFWLSVICLILTGIFLVVVKRIRQFVYFTYLTIRDNHLSKKVRKHAAVRLMEYKMQSKEKRTLDGYYWEEKLSEVEKLLIEGV